MFICFLSNFINHHQIGVANALFELTNGKYRFIETERMPDSFRKTGYPDYSKSPFVIRMWENEEQKEMGYKLVMDADVLVFGGNKLAFSIAKDRINKCRFTIEMSERWLKKGILNLLSPNLFNESFNYWIGRWYKKPVYRLCMSAYAANDLYLLQQYKNRCFKWGYFTRVDEFSEVEAPIQGDSTLEITPLLWCARFLKWKHPELPVLLAKRLKVRGYSFRLDMYGDEGNAAKHDGIYPIKKLESLIAELGVEDCVKICGNLPNAGILKEMRKHKIFLFTSDRHEGWGAVLNEAMANGCVPVGSNEIGSVPYLINDGVNGMIFQSRDLDSLEEKVISLINNPIQLKSMSKQAKETMKLWSPTFAAERLIDLIERLQRGEETIYTNGPCSKAIPYVIAK